MSTEPPDGTPVAPPTSADVTTLKNIDHFEVDFEEALAPVDRGKSLEHGAVLQEMRHAPMLPAELATRWMQRLLADRLIVICSAHPTLRTAALRALLSHPECSTSWDLRDDPKVLPAESLACNESILAFYRWLDEDHPDLFGQVSDALQLGRTRSELNRIKSYAVILTTPQHLALRCPGGISNTWHVEALPAIFARTAIPDDEHNGLTERVEALQARQLLAQDPGTLFRALDVPNAEALDERLKALEGAAPNLPAPPPGCPERVRDAILWIAVFLPNLPAADLHTVMDVLLAKETSEAPPLPEGGDESALQIAPPTLRQVWRSIHTRLLEPLRLRFDQPEDAPDGGPRLLLDEPYNSISRRFFDGLGLLTHYDFLDRIESGQLLFSNEPSIAKAVVHVIVQEAVRRPKRFGAGSLRRIVWPEPTKMAVDYGTFVVQVEEQLGDDDQRTRRRILDRVGALMRAMYRVESLQRMVEKHLVAWVDNPVFRSGLPHVIRCMRAHPDFDVLYWCRQLLEKGADEERAQARRIVQSSLRSATMVPTLDRLSGWLDARNPRIPAAALGAFIEMIEWDLDAPYERPVSDMRVFDRLADLTTRTPLNQLVKPLLSDAGGALIAQGRMRYLSALLLRHLTPPTVRKCFRKQEFEALTSAMVVRLRVPIEGAWHLEKELLIAILTMEWDRRSEGQSEALLSDLLRLLARHATSGQVRHLERTWMDLEGCLQLADRHLRAQSPRTVDGRRSRRDAIDTIRARRRQIGNLCRRFTLAVRSRPVTEDA